MDKKTAQNNNLEYMALMDLLHVSVSKHLMDEHYTVVWANAYYYEEIGYSKKEYERLFHNQCDKFYVNDALGIHDGELWNQVVDHVTDALRKGESGYAITTRMRQKSGRYVWVRMTAVFLDEYIDGKRVSYTTMTDITDVMTMQKEQSITYDNLPGFIARYGVTKEDKLRFLGANERFYEFFGKGSDDQNPEPVVLSEKQLSAVDYHRIIKRLMSGESLKHTWRMKNKDGEEAWLQINAKCLDTKSDNPVVLVIFLDITDVTELRQMQKLLEEQAESLRDALEATERANRAKSDFLSRMSHDIRTPMNAIIGMTDIAFAHLGDPEKIRDCLKKISLSSQHLLSLINDVLDMSKIESGQIALHNEVMSLPEVMENIVAILQPQIRQKDQQFRIRLQCLMYETFCADALRIRQVFVNILSNAVKFTPVGGQITMTVREEANDIPGTVNLIATFEDTGIGIKEEFIDHIFDAFSREHDSRIEKTEGTGLGMAITKNIVSIMGGDISVESEPGKGTKFEVCLPLKTESQKGIEKLSKPLKVLVADDDIVTCELMSEILDKLGISADVVNSGACVLESLQRASDEKAPYDAVIMDWMMPDMDGVATTQEIRRKGYDRLPILIISAYDYSMIEREAKAVGINGFLTKPIFASTLCEALKKHVLGEGENLSGKKAPTSFAGKRFLLVEDNQINREVATELLSYMGAEVDTAVNGALGLEAFSASKPGDFDMVLMDVQMPVMNGYTAAQKIRELDRPDAATIPILAMTADAFAEDVIAAKNAGMNGHLSKPLDEQTMRREISKYLA